MGLAESGKASTSNVGGFMPTGQWPHAPVRIFCTVSPTEIISWGDAVAAAGDIQTLIRAISEIGRLQPIERTNGFVFFVGGTPTVTTPGLTSTLYIGGIREVAIRIAFRAATASVKLICVPIDKQPLVEQAVKYIEEAWAKIGPTIWRPDPTRPSTDDTVGFVCSYAPSQSKAIAALGSASGGAGGAALAIAKAAGLSVVPHSSGAAIFTGSGGYVAGTLGGAGVGPALVTIGLVVGGTAIAVELACAPRNHPQLVNRVILDSKEYWAISTRVTAAATEYVERVARDLTAVVSAK